MMLTEHLSVETFDAYLDAWQNEDSHRSRLTRVLRASMDEGDSDYQRHRLAMLLHYAEQAEGHADEIDGLDYAQEAA